MTTQFQIADWANATFGQAPSNISVATRANEEMAELLRALAIHDDNPDAHEEIADIVIVLCRLATRMGFDMWDAVERKMAINMIRDWRISPNAHGQHAD